MNAPNPGNWAKKYPDLGTGPVPVAPYLSPEYFELEREKVFKKCWLKVARVEEIAESRDYKVLPFKFADAEVIIIRGEDGEVRSFYNTCSHRGNKVVWQNGPGHAKGGGLQCRFHGWVYGTKGEVLSVPEEGAFFDLDKESCALTPIATDVWEGFVFINFDPQPKQNLKEYLGAMGERLAGFPYGQFSEAHTYQTVLNCNWKVAQDAFSEAYHVNTIHAGTFPDGFSTELLDVQLLGPHHSCGVCNIEGGTPPPVAALSHQFSTASIAKKQDDDKRMLPPLVGNDPRHAFELAVIFPNYLVHILEGMYFTHQFTPIDVDHTLWEGVQYFAPPQNAGERFSHEYGQVLQRNAWLEDTATMEDTHEALKSGAKQQLQLQDGEILIRHLLCTVDEIINR